MIDLIKEINENKFKRGDNYTDFKRGFNRGIDVCEEILNQYNIITAPKEILLSEIINKLKENDWFKTECYIGRKDNDINIQRYCYSYFECTRNDIIVIHNNKIYDILYSAFDKDLKWLYTVWIAGTTIIDDLEGQDEK